MAAFVEPVPDRLDPDRTVHIDLASASLRDDFITRLAVWAKQPPFYAVHDGTMQVICARHCDAMEVYQDRGRFSVEVPKRPGFERFDKFMGIQTLAQVDGARHDRLRKLLAPAFGPTAIAAIEPRIRTLVDSLIDAIVASGDGFDGMADFAAPLMPRVLLDIMYGMDEHEKAAMMRMSDAIPSATRLRPGEPFPAFYVAAFDDARAAIDGLVRRRRRAPGTDLISALILAEEEGDRLTEVELFDQIFSVTAGALQSTASSMAAILYVLHTHPDQLAMVRADHRLVSQAIEECLRYHGPGFLSFPRFATGDTDVGGTFIPAGATVRISPQAACLDAAVYPDPLRVDIMRKPRNMPLFGAGPHMCLGNRLARVTMRIGLERYLARLPTTRLADPGFRPIYRGQVSETQISSLPLLMA